MGNPAEGPRRYMKLSGPYKLHLRGLFLRNQFREQRIARVGGGGFVGFPPSADIPVSSRMENSRAV